jgi:hypothetical protein
MITAKLMGGLGNVMFQIASIYSLALENNVKCDFLHQKSKNQGKSTIEYVDNFFKNVNFNLKDHSSFNFLYKEARFEYDKLPFKDNTIYEGYFQSEKYFINNKELIYDLFDIDLKKISFEENKIAVHIRRGDYVKFSDTHTNLFEKTDYYNKAIQYFGKEKEYVVFSDDIEWCKKNIKLQNVEFSNNKKDYLDMKDVICFKNKIIANSSFSWWSAWLTSEPETVIAPKEWFYKEGPKSWNSIYSRNWKIK